MSDDFSDIGPSHPSPEHAWLQNLVGEWDVESTMMMGPDAPPMVAKGQESVRSLRGLWAYAEGSGEMGPGGEIHHYTLAIGFDLTFKEYRGCFISEMSSHLWTYRGELSEDQKVMTLTCEGPNMMKDGETCMYQDIHTLIDANRRTLTSRAQNEDGSWTEFMSAILTRKSCGS